MKAVSVARNKAVIELSIDEMYRIFHCLDAVITQYDVLDKTSLIGVKDDFVDIHADLCEMMAKITNDKGDLSPPLN